jgi:hypothetical protein
VQKKKKKSGRSFARKVSYSIISGETLVTDAPPA